MKWSALLLLFSHIQDLLSKIFLFQSIFLVKVYINSKFHLQIKVIVFVCLLCILLMSMNNNILSYPIEITIKEDLLLCWGPDYTYEWHIFILIIVYDFIETSKWFVNRFSHNLNNYIIFKTLIFREA